MEYADKSLRDLRIMLKDSITKYNAQPTNELKAKISELVSVVKDREMQIFDANNEQVRIMRAISDRRGYALALSILAIVLFLALLEFGFI